MGGTVIVALPQPDDRVCRVSSEKVPHLTLLYLDERVVENSLPRVLSHLEHVVSSSMKEFGLEVDRRGKLGDKNADVLFFSKTGHNASMISELRRYLRLEPSIEEAHRAVMQFPSWVPHLTLGYPKTPARKESDRDYPISWVTFDRIALWTGDYEGPEFQLKRRHIFEEVGMSDLLHFGIKGMKWGVRRQRKETHLRGSRDVTLRVAPGKKVKTKGGKEQAASRDALEVAVLRQRAKASTVDSLSTKELGTLVQRMNLERSYNSIKYDRVNPVVKWAVGLVSSVGKQQVENTVKSEATRQVASVMNKVQKG